MMFFIVLAGCGENRVRLSGASKDSVLEDGASSYEGAEEKE